MEINSFLDKIEVPATDENQLKDFIAQKGDEIKDAVMTLWKEFLSTNGDESGASTDDIQVLETENPCITDDSEALTDEKSGDSCENKETENSQDMINRFGQETNPEDKEKAINEAFALKIKNKNITLPHGKVNKEYSVEFDIENLGIPEIAEVLFEGLDAAGLQYLPEEKKIKGLPTQAGDHKIVIKCKRKDWQPGKPLFERSITLVINPDPRSMWRNIPTPLDIEYYKPDENKAFVTVKAKTTAGFLGIGKKEIPRKDMVAASQRGRSHAHEGRARDDDFALYFDDVTDWYIITVADGAGSAKYSRKGSEIACQTVVDVCKKQISARKEDFEKSIRIFDTEKSQENRNEVGKILYDIIGNAAFQAYKNIKTEADGQNNPVKDYSTTLILSVCKKFDFGWFIAAFWVGDGGIGIYRNEPAYLKILGEPDGGEFAGQTRFLTMPEIFSSSESIYKRLRFDIVLDFTALILMTDGVTDPKFETDANLNRVEKWNELWEDLNGKNDENIKVEFTDDNEESAEQLLRWLDFWSRGNHDDRTIAILF